MKTFPIREVATCIVAAVALCQSPASAQEGDAPIFDPFTKKIEQGSEGASEKRSGRGSARITDDSETADPSPGFKWPSLPKPKLPTLPKLSLPNWSSESTMPRERMREPEEPSTWTKFSSGTKGLLTKTKQTLMPWTQDDEETTVRRPATTRRPPQKSSRTKGRQVSTEKKSIFSWFSTKDEPKDSFEHGVNGFLSQPRPE